MFDQIIELAIGLSYTFLVLSLLCSAIREAAASMFQTRAKVLLDGVIQLLHEKDTRKKGVQRANAPFRQLLRLDDAFQLDKMPADSLVKQVMQHPLITALMQEGRLPSYIPSAIFARALVDVLYQNCPQAGASAAPGAALLSTLKNKSLARSVRAMVGEGTVDLATFEKAIQQQYDTAMERVTGWYKRRSQLVLFAIGLILAGVMNIDTVALTERLWSNPAEARAIADLIDMTKLQALLKDRAPPEQPNSTTKENESIKRALTELRVLPIGWQGYSLQCPKNPPATLQCGQDWIEKVPGWLITAIAASLGAPFWFDGLGKLMALRGSGTRPAAADNEVPKPPLTLPAYSQPPLPPLAPSQFESEGLSHAERVAIQEKLGMTGQSLNGKLDQATRDLIKVAQIAHQEPPTGMLNPPLVRKILNI